VETASGETIRAPRVVAATGAYGSPHLPALPGLKQFAGRVLHSSDYRSPVEFQAQRVIVVGGGNTAVQIAVELAQSSRVTLTTRSPLHWIPQRPLGRDLHWWLTHTGLDAAPIARWLGHRTLPVLDDGRYRAAIRSDQPDHRQMFVGFDGREAVWTHAEREPVDAVILATGYRPDLSFLGETGALDAEGHPLHRGGVSTSMAGLGYVGLELQRTLSSATIRGVGRDARYVLRRVGDRTPAPVESLR
ncbi:MAG: NAD(P)-binding domain-containing protein, partial [Actinobacteria bacterium]|nr:NAD(P)-binding domain-containing protein [Actinomycetota bacterium]